MKKTFTLFLSVIVLLTGSISTSQAGTNNSLPIDGSNDYLTRVNNAAFHFAGSNSKHSYVFSAAPLLAPVITCPANINTTNTPGLCSKVVTYTATATGSPTPTVTYTFLGATVGSGSGDGSGQSFNIGATTVTLTATNSTGTATCSFVVTVVDNEKPAIACKPNITVNVTPGRCDAVVAVTSPSVSDNCSQLLSGNALNFDGVDDIALVAATSPINQLNQNARTVEVYFKVNDKNISSKKQVIWEEGAQNNGLNIYVYNGELYMGIYSSTQNWIPMGNWIHTPNIQSGQWHNAVLVFDGNASVATDRLKGYLDGQLFGSSSTGGTTLNAHTGANAVGALSNAGVFHDGTDLSTTSSFFGGDIDEIRLWTVARTAAQLAATNTTKLLGTETGLVVYYDFDQGTACGNNSTITILQDRTSTGLNGTLQGFNLGGATCISNFTNGSPAITSDLSLTNSKTGTSDASGTYPVGVTTLTWTAKDLTGNTSTCTQTVTVVNNNVATITASGSTTLCSGGSVTLTASSGSSYLWSNGATTQSISVSTAGSYSVTVSYPSGCSATSAVTNVSVNGLSTLNITPANPIICSGTSITLNSTITNGAAAPVPIISSLSSAGQSSTKLAVGLRKLVSTYSGPAIRLRRSTDNVESDFGFSANELDVVSINTFLGAATGFVTTIYDQSGNGNHFTQTTQSAQPTFVSNGFNGKPNIHTNPSQYIFTNTNFPSPFTVSYAARQVGPNNLRMLSSMANNWLLGWWGGIKGPAYFEGWVSAGFGPADTSPYVYTGTATGSGSSFLYQNGTAVANSAVGNAGPNGLTMNRWQGQYEASDGDFTEVFAFNTVLSAADRQLIENSSGAYYSIFNSAATTTGPSLTVNPTATTAYTINGVDVNGCAVSKSITVTVNPLPSATISGSTSVCVNVSQPVITFTGSNATPPYTFIYTVNGGAQQTITSVGNTAILSVPTTIAGTFTYTLVSVKDASSTTCANTASGSAVVTVNALPTANITASGPTTFCAGGSVGLTASSGNGLTFNGTNRVTVSSTPTLPVGNSTYTIETWVKPKTVSGVNGLIGWGNYGTLNQVNALRFNGPTTLINYWWSNDLTVTIPNILDGKWHHIVATYNGTTRAIYLDGVLKGSDVPSGHNVPSGTTMTLAETWPAANEYFDGSMDEVRIWNVGRTQAQIVASMNSTVPINSAGLVAYYKMDEGSGLSTSDATNNGNNGTLTGNPVWNVPSAAPFAGNFQSISWSPGGATTSSITVTTSGTYTVTVTNASGCTTVSSPTVVTVNPLPAAIVSGTTTVCQNASQPVITFTGSNATAPYTFTYTINGGAQQTVTSVGNTATVSVPTGTAGTFTYALVSVKDASSTQCTNTATGSAVVTINALPVVTASSNSPVNAFGTLNLSASGANTYSWSGPNAFTANTATTSITSVSSANAGVYTVIGTNTATGCTNTATTNVVISFVAATGLTLDGANDYISVPDNNSLDFGSGNFTIETWVNKRALSSNWSNEFIVGKWNTGASPGTNEWDLATGSTASNNIPTFLMEVGTTTYMCTGTTSLQLNTWYHLAVVRNGSSLKIYVNGLLEGSITIPANAVINNTGLNMTMGAFGLNGHPLYFANMNVDELRIWNRALCQAEIQNNKDCELNAAGRTDLIALYHFNQGLAGGNNSGITSVTDASANNFNGTLINSALSGNTSNWTIGNASGNCSAFVPATTPITGITTVCLGGSSTLTNTSTGGVWSSSNTAVATVNTNGVVSSLSAGTTVISYTNDCGGVSTVTFTVNALPTANISGTAAVCQNASQPVITFTGSNATAPYTFTYTINGGAQQTVTSVGNTATISVPTGTAGTFTYALVSVKDASSTQCTNTATGTAVVTVNSAPVFTVCPSNQTFNNAASQCNAVVSYTATATGLPLPTLAYTFSGATTGSGSGTGSGQTFNVGVTTVTITATNACGSVNCSFTITVLDVTSPTIVCPANITINTTPGLCTATATLTAPTVSDNCSTINNNALNFDGTDDNVQLSGQPINPSSFTVEGWINGSSFAFSGRYNRIVAINYGSYNSDNPFCLFVNSNGQIGYVFGTGNTPTDQQVPISTSPVLSTNTWYHIALTFDGNAKRLYVNGALVATINNTATFSNPNNEPLLLGDFKAGETNNGQWNGLLDEVRIWNVARTQTQISANMNAELSAQSGLVTAYHFNQGIAGGNNVGLATVTDASGNGFNGTLNSFALSGITSNWVAGQTLTSSSITLTNNAPATYSLGTTIVTWTATDASGNSSSCNQTVTVLDATPPTISGPSNITTTATSAAGAVVTYATPVGTDNCSGATTVLTTGLVSGSTFPIGTTTVTYTVTDGAGLTAQTSFTVTVLGLAPQISCPANITINANAGQCGTNVSFAATETTGIPASTITYSIAPGSFFAVGTTTVTATATNAVGTSTCSFTVTVVDVTPPSITCPANIAVSTAANKCAATISIANATATDNCSVATITGTRSDGLALTADYPKGTTTIVWTAKDAAGNTSTCSQTVTVTDNVAPTVITKNITVNLDASGTANITASQVDNGSTDNCGIASMVLSKSTFNCADIVVSSKALSLGAGSDGVTTNANANIPTGNSARTFSAWINPTQSNSIIGAVHQGNNDCTGLMFGMGFSGGKLFFWGGCKDFSSNLSIPLNQWSYIAVTYDGNNNFVLYKDGQSHPFTLAGGLNTQISKLFIGHETTNNGTSYRNEYTGGVDEVKVYNRALTASEIAQDRTGSNVSGLVAYYPFNEGTGTVINDVVGGNTATLQNPTGSNWITRQSAAPASTTLTVTDLSGNIASATATVTVIDNIAPVFTVCPANQTLIATSAAGATVTYTTPTATDNCSAVVARTTGLASGATFPIGTTTVTHTATDPSGNSVTCTFTVTVSGLAPQIVCPSNITVNATTGQCGANVPFTATETTAIPASVISYKENSVTVTPGSFFSVGTHTITATATNAVGSSSCNFTITVVDNQFPVLVGVPANVTVECDAVPVAAIVTATDNCSTSVPTFTETRTNGNCISNYTLTRTWSTTDASNNTTAATQIITVRDTKAPVLSAAPANITVECNAVPSAAILTATDNCDAAPVVTYNEVRTNGSSNNDYILTRTWTATDACNNVSTKTQVITVHDTQAPVLTVPSNITVDNDVNACGAVINFIATATDNCSPVTITYSNNPGSTFPVGITTVTVTAKDQSNNITVKTFTVTVKDVTAPVIICAADITINNTPGLCTGTTALTAPLVSDNCNTSFGNALSFDGLNDYVQVPYSASNNPNVFTAEAWVLKQGVASGYQSVLTSRNSSSGLLGYIIYAAPTDKWEFWVGNGAWQVLTGPSITYNSWTHLAVTYDGTKMQFYVNGVLSGTKVTTFVPNNAAPLRIGAGITEASPGFFFNGKIDEVRIWNQPLTQTQIQAGMNVESNPQSGLVSLYHFNQGTAAGNNAGITSATDDSGNGHNGILNGFALNGSTSNWIAGIGSGSNVTVTNNAPASYPIGTTTVTWTATDAAGNSSTCNQKVTVVDNQFPALVGVPANITVECDAVPAAAVVTATDNCSTSVPTFRETRTNGNCPSNYTLTRTWSTTDASGNTTTKSQIITVQDTKAPVLSAAPADVTVSCDAIPGAAVLTAEDNCDAALVVSFAETSTQSADLGNVAHYNYTITRVWTATDACGNASSKTQIITVQDVTKPLITVPASVIVNCQDDNTSISNGVATATDNCADAANITITQTDVSTYSADPSNVLHYNYVITRTWRAVDVAGNFNEAVQTITVQDVTKPIISCPAPIVLNCQDDHTSSVTGVATATDNCADFANITITQSDVSTYSADLANINHYNYTITRTWRAKDVAGNYSECDQLITVRDVTAPIITCPASITVNCQDDHSSDNTGVATAIDNCADVANIVISETETSTYSADLSNINHYNYTITRTWRATDVAGNYSECDQLITVHDVTKPIITCPAPVTVNCQDDYTSAATGMATAIDNCADAANIVISETETSTYSADLSNINHYNYTITRTWRATDVAGNYSECNQVITVEDVTKPIIVCPAAITVNCQDDHTSAATGVATATDNCADVSNIVISETETSTYSADLSNINHYNYTITRTWRATDVAGNYSECDQIITVQDVTKPIITCPAPVTVNCQDDHTSAATGVATATDNCADVANISITSRDVSSYNADPSNVNHYNYVISRIWRATDVAGNYSECVQKITVHDVTAPTIVCPESVMVNCQDNNTSTATGVATATDNCADAANIAITQNDVSTQDADITKPGHYNYTISRTWRATDVAGNYSECVQIIMVHDVTAPIIICPESVIINCQDNNTSSATGVATATDNCADAANIAITQNDVSTQDVDISKPGHYNYTISRTWRATDVSGNYSECVQIITVHDITKPVITCPAPVTVNCQDDHTSASTGVATAIDNCAPSSNITITESEVSTYNANPSSVNHYNYIITRTWRATDVVGNYSECDQIITVRDVTRPVITCPAPITLNCQDDHTSSVTGVATATDNCAPAANISITQNDVSTYSSNPSSVLHYNYTITRTWKATDVAGNYSTCDQIITVRDITKPVLTYVPGNITVVCSAPTTPSATGMATGTDNCASPEITYSDVVSANGLQITRTWKATDVAGNFVTGTPQIITILPLSVTITSIPTSSIYTGGSSTNLYIGYGAQSTVLQVNAASQPSAGAPYTYSWSGSNLNQLSSTSSSSPTFTVGSTSGYYTYTVTVTNRYGCSKTATISICVTDVRVAGSNGKVYVCHLPPGNTANRQTLSISVNAVDAHLTGHTGDRLGSCEVAPCVTSVSTSSTPIITSITKQAETSVATTEEELKVTVMPNPSTTYFTLKLESKYETPVSMRVMDGTGRVVDAKSKIGANSTIQIGHNYSSGTYYAELIQGTKRKVVQLIKAKG